jgi:biotin carboxyl carrier protein
VEESWTRGGLALIYDVEIGGRCYRVELTRVDATGDASAKQNWQCRVNGREIAVDSAQPERDVLSLLIGGQSYEIERERIADGRVENGDVNMVLRGRRYVAEVRDPRALRSRKRAAGLGAGPRRILAPMPGKIIRILVSEGATVEAGDSLMVIEAMKMQNEIKAPKAGVLQKLLAVEGVAVNSGDVLAVVE